MLAIADDMTGNLIVKVPLSLPYPIRTEEYAPASGKITYNGKSYEMIKQRHYQDTLYVVCIVDQEQSIVAGKVKEYNDAMAEARQDRSKELKPVTPFAKYCLSPPYQLLVHASGWARTQSFGERSNLYDYSVQPSLLRPPSTTLG